MSGRVPCAALLAFVTALTRARTTRGLTIHELARLARVPAATVLALERPRYGDPVDVRLDYLRQLAAVLGLDFSAPAGMQAGTGVPLFACRCGRFTERAASRCVRCVRTLTERPMNGLRGPRGSPHSPGNPDAVHRVMRELVDEALAELVVTDEDRAQAAEPQGPPLVPPVVRRSRSLADARAQGARLQTEYLDLKARIQPAGPGANA